MNKVIRTFVKIGENQYRKNQKVILYNFDADFNQSEYEVFGYLQGDKVDRLKDLTIFHYDSIQFIEKSTNAKKGGEFIHAVAHRFKENTYKTIILKRKQ